VIFRSNAFVDSWLSLGFAHPSGHGRSATHNGPRRFPLIPDQLRPDRPKAAKTVSESRKLLNGQSGLCRRRGVLAQRKKVNRIEITSKQTTRPQNGSHCATSYPCSPNGSDRSPPSLVRTLRWYPKRRLHLIQRLGFVLPFWSIPLDQTDQAVFVCEHRCCPPECSWPHRLGYE